MPPVVNEIPVTTEILPQTSWMNSEYLGNYVTEMQTPSLEFGVLK
jgi:hypothetical protein